MIDTTQVYENKKEISNAIKSGGVARDHLFITTKIYRPNNSYQGTKSVIDVSLKNLRIGG